MPSHGFFPWSRRYVLISELLLGIALPRQRTPRCDEPDTRQHHPAMSPRNMITKKTKKMQRVADRV
jgi:hypothetical protein